MVFCTKCGKELSDEALFCDKCGNRVNKEDVENLNETDTTVSLEENTEIIKPTAKMTKQKWIIISAIALVLIIGITVLSISIASGKKSKAVNADVEISTENVEVEEKSKKDKEEKDNSKLSEAEQLREIYFSARSANALSFYFDNTAEILVRNQSIFNGVLMRIDGKVDSILPTENSNEFSLSVDVSDEYSQGSSALKYVNVEGMYKDTDQRFIEGDSICVIGTYDRIENFKMTDGTYTNCAVITNCTLYGGVDTTFPLPNIALDLQEIKTVLSTIFGSEIDVRSSSIEIAGDEWTCYELNTKNGSDILKWKFGIDGWSKVSFDNGQYFCDVTFSSDYKTFYATEQRYDDSIYVLKYCKLDGTVVWTKEFENKENSCFVAEKNYAYLLADDYLHILKSKNGEEIVEPILVKNITSMKLHNDLLILFDENYGSNEIIVMDLSGQILWRDTVAGNYTLSDHHHIINDEILLTYSNNPTFYFRRLKIETGELINELEI